MVIELSTLIVVKDKSCFGVHVWVFLQDMNQFRGKLLSIYRVILGMFTEPCRGNDETHLREIATNVILSELLCQILRSEHPLIIKRITRLSIPEDIKPGESIIIKVILLHVHPPRNVIFLKDLPQRNPGKAIWFRIIKNVEGGIRR